ncbi:Subtilisin-like protease SBT1.6 [Linum grandiflorum]
MARILFSRLSFLFLLFSLATSLSTSSVRKTYIVHMDKTAAPSVFSTPHDWYMSILSSMSSADMDVDEKPIHLYTYKHVINGFSAVLSQAELDKLEQIKGHVASFPESYGRKHTTHSPRFLGLNKHTGLWPAGKFGDDVIIGVLDTGIWPESESFNDELMPPVPARWRGTCESGVEFNASNCNRKLIGARKFSKGMEQQGLNLSTTYDYDSPRDYLGHGTHTSSTAAGSRVSNADYFGYARGTATGIAPMARLAMYKVLFNDDGMDGEKSYDAAATDVLAGMDQAIEDGVDVMSLSLGFFETVPFFRNPIAIGSFAAMKRGIFVACSAGNGGPHGYTMLNGAPWITTVGAGTLDRDLGARIVLGEDDLTVTGHSMYPENLFIDRVPLYFGRGNRSMETCDVIDLSQAAGKFVFCDHDDDNNRDAALAFKSKAFYSKDDSSDNNGVVAGIIQSMDDAEFYSHATDFETPIVMVSTKIGDSIKRYILNSTNSTVSVNFGVTIFGNKPAPKVTYFSSRGPDERSPWILKPDILAPGYDILAAWTPNRAFAPIRGGDDYLQTDYAIISGTSMSCPHIAGLGALLRSAHKDWTLAAIRSAMMTTSYITDNVGGTIIDMTTGVAGTPLDYGSGHVDPNKALDPGLVYDIATNDYVNYLCAMNYTKSEIAIITGEAPESCEFATLDLNYPSFMVVMNNTNTSTVTFSRVVTNVADGASVYRAVVEISSGLKAVVEPSVIRFGGKYSTAAFNLTVDAVLVNGFGGGKSDEIGSYGFLSWVEVNGTHVVRSPIVSAIASPRT